MKATLIIAAAMAALAASPASAAIYTYTQSNGDKLVINSDTKSGTMTGTKINVSFTSDDFANFTGGAKPSFSATLSSLDGTRLVNGTWLTDNPKDATTTHPQKLIFSPTDVNLWAWWGNPIKAGDYITHYGSYTASSSGGTQVPAPGMVGLFALGAAGLVYRRRRQNKAAPAKGGKLAFA
jgi:PEP-CTERM motif